MSRPRPARLLANAACLGLAALRGVRIAGLTVRCPSSRRNDRCLWYPRPLRVLASHDVRDGFRYPRLTSPRHTYNFGLLGLRNSGPEQTKHNAGDEYLNKGRRVRLI